MVASTLIFANPAWLWLLPAAILTGLSLWKFSRSLTRKRVGRFLAPARTPEVLSGIDWRSRLLRFALTAAAISLMAIALARPLTGPKSDVEDERQGADIVVALDVSKSMWVPDIAPTRLDAAKKALSEWTQSLKKDRAGLVLFAGEAFVGAPLTFDRTAFDFVLQDAGPKSISKGGSNITKAIETASKLMANNKVEHKFLLIISDGENLDGDAIAAARQAHQDHITIHTIGVGTATGGKVPRFDPSSRNERYSETIPENKQFVQTESGTAATSRLDSHTLRAIANVAGGTYSELKPGEPIFQRLRERNIATAMEKSRKINARDYHEWFQLPLGLALLLLAVEPLLCRVRRKTTAAQPGVAVIRPANLSRRRKASGGKPRPVSSGALGLLFITLLSTNAVPDLHADPLTEKAEHFLSTGKPEEAVEFMRRQAEKDLDPHVSYNYGLTLYRAGRFEEAVVVFQTTEALATDRDLKAMALFQTGNAQSRIGDQLLQGDVKSRHAAVKILEQALSSYQVQAEMKSGASLNHNRKLASEKLQGLLVEIGEANTKAGSENMLREALQAFERAAELDSKHEPLAKAARNRLSDALAQNAASLDQETDLAEAGQKELSPPVFKHLLARREQILSKLQEAATLTPDNDSLRVAIEQQQRKMSNLLTAAARDEAWPSLAEKKTYSPKDIANLENALEKVDQALTLNASNLAARELQDEVKKGLVDAHVQNGEQSLDRMNNSMETEARQQSPKPGKETQAKQKKPSQDQSQLANALKASESFQSALELDPNHAKAKEGLATVESKLSELHAEVGENNLAQAESKLAGSNAAGAEPKSGQDGDSSGGNEGKSSPQSGPSSNGSSGQKGQGKSASKATNGKAGESSTAGSSAGSSQNKRAGALQSASALLENAQVNLSAAAKLQPGNEKLQTQLARAESLLTSVREELDATRSASGAGGETGEQNGTPAGTGSGQAAAGAAGESTLKSMSSMVTNPGAGGGGVGGGDSKREQGKFVKDW